MAKKRTKKLLVVLSVAVALSVLLGIGVSATNIYNTDLSTFYKARMPIKDITVTSPYDYGISGVNGYSVTINDAFDGIMDLQPTDSVDSVGNPQYLRMGTYINFPLQHSDYTSSGRLVTFGVAKMSSGFFGGMFNALLGNPVNLVYDFALYEESRLNTPSEATRRNILNGSEITIHFDDFLTSEELTGIFRTQWNMYCPFDTPDDMVVVLNYTYAYKKADGYLDERTFEKRYEFSYEAGVTDHYQCVVNTLNNFPKPPESSTDDFIIRDMSLTYYPYGENYQHLTDRRLYDAQIISTADSYSDSYEYYYSNELLDYFGDNPIEHYYVEGLGDVSFTDWLETAVGGFLDFEFVPGVSFGGLVLVLLGVGLLMLLIRIFKG